MHMSAVRKSLSSLWVQEFRRIQPAFQRCSVNPICTTSFLPYPENLQDVPAQPSEPETIDAYLKSINLKYKLKQDSIVKHDYNLQRARVPFSSNPRRTSVSSQTLQNEEPSIPTQRLSDPSIVFTTVEAADQAGKNLPIRDLFKYSSVLAQHGRIDGVELCQKIMSEHYEDEFNQEMQLKHYLANALWNAVRFRDSVDLFKKIFHDHPVQRRRIGDMFRFGVIRALSSYPNPEQQELINEFIDYAASLKEYQVGAYLWRSLFQHSAPSANEEAHALLIRHPQLKGVIHSQFTGLLERARKERDSGLLYRMLSLLKQIPTEFKDFKHLTGCVFDGLMEIYCGNMDVVGAEGLVRLANEHALEYGNVMWPETVRRLEKIRPREKPVEVPRKAPVVRPRGLKMQF